MKLFFAATAVRRKLRLWTVRPEYTLIYVYGVWQYQPWTRCYRIIVWIIFQERGVTLYHKCWDEQNFEEEYRTIFY